MADERRPGCTRPGGCTSRRTCGQQGHCEWERPRLECAVAGCLFTCEWPGELDKHMLVHAEPDEITAPDVARAYLAEIRAKFSPQPEPARVGPSTEDVIRLLAA